MAKRKSKRQKAIVRRNVFLLICGLVIVAVIVGAVAGINAILPDTDNNSSSQGDTSSGNNTSGNTSSDIVSTPEKKDDYDPQNKQMIDVNGVMLDANFRRVLLVNGENPLPEDYDKNIRAYLQKVEAKYRNNNYVTDLHKDIIPYVNAMVQKAHDDGVDLRVWSPFRSYAIQKDLFQKQVKKQEEQGLSGEAAENKAATVVARPGTSEHNTGLCADFNMASSKFETTEMFTWMCENAEDYGFILRYPKEKLEITGVIYESWHWRFVGINTAKEMNKLGMTLEEYVEYKEIDWKSEL